MIVILQIQFTKKLGPLQGSKSFDMTPSTHFTINNKILGALKGYFLGTAPLP